MQTRVDGSERTSFDPTVEATAARFGMAVVPDEHPKAGHYFRSPLHGAGRGSCVFESAPRPVEGGTRSPGGLAKEDDYMAHRYHNFSDNYRPEMDFTSNVKLTRFGFELGWEVPAAPASITVAAGR
jgi:hypothetical protein